MASFDSIDETPLSTASHERRNSLEKHLQTRPGMQDLKDRHILLDTNVAPWEIWLLSTKLLVITTYTYIRALQAARQDLDRQRAQDNLKKNLERRPDREELIERMLFVTDLTIPTLFFPPLFLFNWESRLIN